MDLEIPRISMAIETCEIWGGKEKNLLDLEHSLQAQFGTEGCITYAIYEGKMLAVNFTNQRVLTGLNPENLANVKKMGQVTRFIADRYEQVTGSKFTPRSFDPLPLGVPDSKYRITLVLPPGETDRPYCMGMRSRVISKKLNWLRVEMKFRKGISREIAYNVTEIVRKWKLLAENQGFSGERVPGELKVEKDRGALNFLVADYEPVSIPWFELYARLRYNLKPEHRPSRVTFTDDLPGESTLGSEV